MGARRPPLTPDTRPHSPRMPAPCAPELPCPMTPMQAHTRRFSGFHPGGAALVSGPVMRSIPVTGHQGLPFETGPQIQAVPTPCYLLDWPSLVRNCELLGRVQAESGGRIILALKGFAMFSTFPLVRRYLRGTTASGLHEALLGRDEFGGEVHVFSPAYKQAEMEQLLEFAHHIVFNSLNQWRRYRDLIRVRNSRPGPGVHIGLRCNPEHSETDHEIYNPCAPGSRLGIRAEDLRGLDLEGIDGLHFHTLCQKNSDALERTVDAFEARFAEWIPHMRWLNFGGGHHITRPDYDVDRLVRVIRRTRERHGVDVYLEPGEAIGLNTGVLIAEVQDIVHNHMQIAILDTSATCHMPDVLEMPYRPEIFGGDLPGAKAHTYRLGGPSCLAGDVIGDYSFDQPLKVGDRLVFGDMIHYTMVKTTFFNGVPHPAIAIWRPDRDEVQVVREFGYADYRNKLS